MAQDYIEFQTVTGSRGGKSKIWQAIAAGEIVGNYTRKIDAETALDAAIEARRTFKGFTASVDYDRQDWQHTTIYQGEKPVLNVSAPRMFGEFKTWTVTDAIGGCVYDSRVKPSLATLARLARGYVETMQEGAAYRVANEVTTPEQEEWLEPIAPVETVTPIKDSPEYDLNLSAVECDSAFLIYGEDLVSGYAEGLQELHGGNAAEWESRIRAKMKEGNK